MISKEQFEFDSNKNKKDAFARWMNEPMVRAIISTVPECNMLEPLLRGCFETGYVAGSVHSVISFHEHIMKVTK